MMHHQYRKWVYPRPIINMIEAIERGAYIEIGNPLDYWPLMWPDLRGADFPLDVLCAGCGSNQAAYYACLNQKWNVVGVDVSDSSLSYQQALIEKHHLSNLELYELDLTRIGELNRKFDFITCTGVLHHLDNPDVGLKALASTLRPNGVMNLMVYGKTLRMGVYPLQEAFQILGLQQTQDDIEVIKSVLQSVPADHAVQRYVRNANDLSYDAGIVDTFLNPVDQAYSVKDVYAFTQRAGLEIMSWCEPAEYSLRAQVPDHHPLWKKLTGLSDKDAAHVCDLLLQARGTHRWIAAHPDYAARARIPFESSALFDCTVRLTPGAERDDAEEDFDSKLMSFKRGNLVFKIPRYIFHLIERMNGIESVHAACQSIGCLSPMSEVFRSEIATCFRELYGMGHIQVLLPTQSSQVI